MIKSYQILFFVFFGLIQENTQAQRQYASSSVLSTGDWYKVAILKEGIYKIDASFISSLGFQQNQIASTDIKLFGNGGKILSYNNAISRLDDLVENAIEVHDGGDGIFNDNDFFLFYAPGPDSWKFNVIDSSFNHEKNLINDTCYYFITISNSGKRIQTNNNALVPNCVVNSFDERLFHEIDKINLLKSGKHWLGEQFNNTQQSHSFNYSLTHIQSSSPLKLKFNLLARSIGTPSRFDISANGQFLQNVVINAVSGNLIDNYAESQYAESKILSPASNFNLTLTFNPATNISEGWLDWFEIQYRKKLHAGDGSPFSFRDFSSVGNNSVAQFIIDGASSRTEVWDISNFIEPIKLNSNFSNNQLTFINDASILREYIVFDHQKCLQPLKIGKLKNQNLHQYRFADYIIITPKIFIDQANRLAQFHQSKNNLMVQVVETEQIYNEFGGGNSSAASIRDYIKFCYDKVDSNQNRSLKYVLLFGIGNYDTKGRTNTTVNHIPCFESENALNPILSYTSDDFFALLSDTDNINDNNQTNELKIAVGRLPVLNSQEANMVVDKIIHYQSNETLGAWRNDILLVADDKDANIFFNTSEQLADTISNTNTRLIINKVYVDAYPLKSVYNNTNSPQVNQSIIDQLFAGKLIVNYSGHGNYQQLSSYSIFGKQEANQLNNANKLPFFITSTCDFIPFDDPSKPSLGSYLLAGNRNGAIGLVTTPRIVFAEGNQIVNNTFIKNILKMDSAGNHFTIGECLRITKNEINQSLSDKVNTRKISLIGDPALKITFPYYNIQIDSINQRLISNGDTIYAGNEYIVSGKIKNQAGEIIPNFNGTVTAKVFDKPKKTSTLGNDPTSIATNYFQQEDLIYSGKSTVNNGMFTFSFYTTHSIEGQPAKGKISLYAENGYTDASGFDTSFYISSNNLINNNDVVGPEIKLFIDDYQFKNGNTVGDRGILLVKLSDQSGINTINNGIRDHDIKLIIDGDEGNPIVLNSFYECALNTFKIGGIIYQLPSLTKGEHTLKLTAWDNVGNNSTSTLNFNIIENNQIQIYNLINYPNPVRHNTNISFQLNEPARLLKIYINFYSLDGKLIAQTKKDLTNTNRFIDFPCNVNFRRLSSGVYFYRLRIVNEKGEEGMASQKMIKLD